MNACLTKKRGLVACCFFATLHVGLTRSAEVVVRTATEPQDSAWIGQRIILQIDVLGEDGWASLPKLPSIDLRGAIVFAPPSTSVRLNETIDGDSYTGQRYEWWLYPQRTGSLEIPSIDLSVQLKTFDANTPETSETKTSQSTSLEVNRPPETNGIGGLVCATRFSSSQSWSSDSSEFQVGDGITRTITRTVENVPGLAIEPVEFGEQVGPRVYVKEPEVNDQFNRGELVGERTESVTYLFESPGQVEIPSVSVTWWDLEQDELQREVLEGRQITVKPTSKSAANTPDETATNQPPSMLRFGISAALIAITLMLGWFWRPIRRWISQRIRQRRSSEPAYFQRVLTAAKSNDAGKTLTALMAWLDRIAPENKILGAEHFLSVYGDEQDAGALQKLYLAVDQPSSNVDASRLGRSLQSARHRWLRKKRRSVANASSTLPELNPSTR